MQFGIALKMPHELINLINLFFNVVQLLIIPIFFWVIGIERRITRIEAVLFDKKVNGKIRD